MMTMVKTMTTTTTTTMMMVMIMISEQCTVLNNYAHTLSDGDFPGRKLVCVDTLDGRSVPHAVNVTVRRTAAFCADNSPGRVLLPQSNRKRK